MDKKESDLKKGEKLPQEDRVYRIVVSTFRDRKNKAIPALRCFDLSRQDDNKLSVDWEAKTTPEECIARVGASYKFDKDTYKSYKNREIYALNITFLNSLQEIEKTIYDPIINDPPEKGKPNNPAHSLIVFHRSFLKDEAQRPETLIKLRDHAKNNKIAVNHEELDKLVKRYRN